MQHYSFAKGNSTLNFQFQEDQNLLTNKLDFVECLKLARQELEAEIAITLNKKKK